MKFSAFFLLALLLTATTTTLSASARSDPTRPTVHAPPPGGQHRKDRGSGIPGAPPGGYFGPGGGFGIPGFGSGWPSMGGGYGSGYGGPSGGSSRGGIVRPTVVCKDKGPCFMKKLTCPSKCFTSFHRSGKGYGGGGGGGGCTVDCKNKCLAYC